MNHPTQEINVINTMTLSAKIERRDTNDAKMTYP